MLYCTALHCTVLYCTVLYCTALHCTALHCTALHCTALHCTVLCCAVLYCNVLCCAVLCCTVMCCAVLCCAVLCCAVLCCAVLCCAVLCCAVLYCTVSCSAPVFKLPHGPHLRWRIGLSFGLKRGTIPDNAAESQQTVESHGIFLWSFQLKKLLRLCWFSLVEEEKKTGEEQSLGWLLNGLWQLKFSH